MLEADLYWVSFFRFPCEFLRNRLNILPFYAIMKKIDFIREARDFPYSGADRFIAETE